MINGNIYSLGSLCDGLRHECNCFKQATYGRSAWAATPDQRVSADNRKRLRSMLELATIVANDFEWKAAHDRIKRFGETLDDDRANLAEVYHELQALSDAIQDGTKRQLVYRYPTEKANVFLSWKADWSTVIKSFPSAEEDIRSGVDLWALGHSTASIFHMMRVLEHGLKALSLDLGLPYSTQNWYNIINEISKKISEQEKTLPKGDAKAARLQFLSEAAKEFVYFKDGWRNFVSHAKCAYDENQARSVMEHVRQFMATLSRDLSLLSEQE